MQKNENNKPVEILSMSDLHMEGRPATQHKIFAEQIWQEVKHMLADGKVPVLVFAGDVNEGTKGIEWISQFNMCEIIYICGNHEFWNGDYFETIENIRAIAKEHPNIHFLHNESVVVQGIRFVGATLWTDLGESWGWVKKNQIVRHHFMMNDFNRITAKAFYDDEKKVKQLVELLDHHDFSAEAIQKILDNKSYNPIVQFCENKTSREFLKSELAKPYDGETIVVTHHLPVSALWRKALGIHDWLLNAAYINTAKAYSGYFQGKVTPQRDVLMAGFYVNNLEPLIDHHESNSTIYSLPTQQSPLLWIHGHLHRPMDGFVGTTRIVSDPTGYLKQSEDLHIKKIPVNPESSMDAFITQSIQEIKDFKGFEEIKHNLSAMINALKCAAGGWETKAVQSSDLNSVEVVSGIIDSFKAAHDKNLKGLEAFISSILLQYLRLKKRGICISSQLFVTAFASGLSTYTQKNGLRFGVDTFRFEVEETSLNSSSPEDSQSSGQHYLNWISEVEDIIEQVDNFQNLLIAFLKDSKVTPLEEVYKTILDSSC